MASDNEPAKLLLPYLQRADELQKHEPLVAYYCRLYAMERGLKIPQSERTKTTNSILVSLMNQLEKVDPNTGASMYETDDIIKYLVGKYGDGKVPLMLSLGLLTTLTAGLALIGRSGKMLIHM